MLSRTPRLLIWILLVLFPFGAGAADPFVLAIDIGHTPRNPGARSARGEPEYQFNRAMALALRDAMRGHKGLTAYIINEEGARISLAGRPSAALAAKADLLLSLHHDSVQPQYLKEWSPKGEKHRYCDRFSGHSLFVSKRNGNAGRSLQFARLLGERLRQKGLKPTLHHAEPISGENRELLDERLGLYRYDGLAVLKGASMPAVLLECGIIVNRWEERRVSLPAYRKAIADAIVQALLAYLQPPAPRSEKQSLPKAGNSKIPLP
ncbi:MAG: N-acetylmuramoyl-L-alanine amidase [Gammaproteobacteria bacterium]|nr:N-acetylmuramoyl-L-alanine amidase [Gammaproteobacteria bacterium]MBU1655374.1 N-acetylmuramoyl-L-alanine amidase [Gammaproteobacteria bacterium]MBU1960352.1 N-acetylmuramoyl-L-alanine amidase [Gammaproteobacteria bacterium]